MLKIYGNRKSRTIRCFCALEELGLDYEYVTIDHTSGESKSPDYLALNPAGKVPTLVDGDLVLFESIAINFYLAQKYKGTLWSEDPVTQALALQWSFWAVAEIEPYVLTLAQERVFKPEHARDAAKAEAAEQQLKARLPVLDAHLQKMGGRLTTDDFNIADLNVACVLSAVRLYQLDLTTWPAVKTWLESVMARPAIRKAMEG